jgi:hypothetical protein
MSQYGSEEQKDKFLPRLATGELIGECSGVYRVYERLQHIGVVSVYMEYNCVYYNTFADIPLSLFSTPLLY